MLDDLKMRTIDNRLLSTRIRVELLDWIKKHSGGDKPFKLPGENELARSLGVSRTGLRDALTVMEAEGYIIRRRGIGTLVNPKIARSRTRIDLQTEMCGMIEAQGFESRFKVVELELINASLEDFSEEEKSYIAIEKVFYANGTPVSICLDRLAAGRLESYSGDINILNTVNIYDFIKNQLGIQSAYSFSNISAVFPTNKQSELLDIKRETPLLALHNVSYDRDHLPYLSSDVIIRTDILGVSLLRKPV